MAKVCDHNIRDTKKGAGPCDIRFEVRKRNGTPNYWCHTHGHAASAPDGAPLDACPGSWFDAVAPEQQEEFDLVDGEYALWGAVEPAITLGSPPIDEGSIHVHRRPHAGAEKDVDGSYDIIRLRSNDRTITVEGMAAKAFSISTLLGKTTVPLACPHCGEVHIDELQFATQGHRKHLCNSCGRNFWNANDTISNPLAEAHADLGLPAPPPPVRASEPLDLRSTEWDSIALWPSNPAFVNTMSRPEHEGVHVHAWKDGRLEIDETYSPVTLDGEAIDEDALRMLTVQRSLAEGAPIVNVSCDSCGAMVISPSSGWIRPMTAHQCNSCGATTKTRRKSFTNPLVDKP